NPGQQRQPDDQRGEAEQEDAQENREIVVNEQAGKHGVSARFGSEDLGCVQLKNARPSPLGGAHEEGEQRNEKGHSAQMPAVQGIDQAQEQQDDNGPAEHDLRQKGLEVSRQTVLQVLEPLGQHNQWLVVSG